MKQRPVLNGRRRAVAEVVARWRDAHGFGPEVPEIAFATGQSIGSVQGCLNWLRHHGVVTFEPWDDEHHWRSFDRGPEYERVVVLGERPRTCSHRREEAA